MRYLRTALLAPIKSYSPTNARYRALPRLFPSGRSSLEYVTSLYRLQASHDYEIVLSPTHAMKHMKDPKWELLKEMGWLSGAGMEELLSCRSA
jgi:hypothetical protein